MRNFIKSVLLLSCFIGYAQYPNQEYLSNIPAENYQMPEEVPPYMEPIPNAYNNIVTRVSDDTEFGFNSQRLGHNYSKDQAWNSDQTMIKLSGYPAVILDAETYEPIRYDALIPGYGRWSNLDPNLIYGTNGNQWKVYDYATNTRTTVRTFEDYSSVDFGYGEGNFDFEDRNVVLIGRKTNGDRFLIHYRMDLDFIISEIPISNNADLDWASISTTGHYIVAAWRPDGSGETQGLKRYDYNTSSWIHLSDRTGHGVLALDPPSAGDENFYGTEVLVQIRSGNDIGDGYSFEKIVLGTGEVTNIFYWDPNIPIHEGYSGVWGAHLSFAINRPGYVYISEGCCWNHGALPSAIFSLKIDGSDLIERYGWHNTNHRSDAGFGYGHEAKASVNRDGNKIIYNSNGHDSNLTYLESGYAHIVEVPEETLAVSQEDYESDFNYDLAEVTIYDLLSGQMIYESVDVSKIKDLEKGFYVIVYKWKDQIRVRKIYICNEC